MQNDDPLRFQVAPHIVEDLGLNLYTDLPRVLVEFIANAHDADSAFVDIRMDLEAIKRARQVVRKQFELDQAKASAGPLSPLAGRTLPEDICIVVEDGGCGMSREDLRDKFLVAGRRRRQEEPDTKGRTPANRPLMGRKGLGKLAGFGVAKIIEVVTRKKGESHATRIVLDYDSLVKERNVLDAEIEEERDDNGGGLAEHGTRITLSRLLYDPTKSREETIVNEIAEHFEFIRPEDFEVRLNGAQMKPPVRNHAFAWPLPEVVAAADLVEAKLPTEVGEIAFRYRIRFTRENEALPASKRGVRIYTHNRLAAAPSLLDADTNMHGFRMTDYMDGVVQADFIDEQDADYVATDRQSLRWETPLLAPMKEFLSDQIKRASAAYQKQREDVMPGIVKKDEYTAREIESRSLSKKDGRMALRFASVLAASCKQGVNDPVYQTKLPVIVRSLGHGSILTAISALADQDHPDLGQVAIEIAKLTRDELDQFLGAVSARLKAIAALKKIVEDVNFRAKENEKVLQRLFEKSPWLLDPTFFEFLTADQRVDSLFSRLAKELGVGEHAPKDSARDGRRPDLVFLLGNSGLGRLIIVELKSANTPLNNDHLSQLEYYMEQAEAWLKDHEHADMRIEGHLLGSMPATDSKAEGAVVLRGRIRKAGPEAKWRVRDYLQVLEGTESAHKELLSIQRSAAARDDAEEVAVPSNPVS